MKTKLMLLIFTLSFMVMAACAKTEDVVPEPDWDGTREPITEGNGSDGNPYLIYNAGQLADLADKVNAGDAAWNSKSYELMNDISIGGTEWPMIGYMTSVDAKDIYKDKGKPFMGTFDGKGHIIKNILITEQKSTSVGVGLFGYIATSNTEIAVDTVPHVNVTIKNLRLENGTITGGGLVGGIVGRGRGENATGAAKRVKLSRLSVGGGLKVNGGTAAKDNDKPVGGVAGSIMLGDMSFSYNDGATVTGTQWVAGVVACLHSGELKHSYNSAAVVGNHTVGGVTAHSIADSSTSLYNGTIRTFNVFNRGEVGKASSIKVGGVLALHELGDINNSFNTGTVKGVTASTGQIVGEKKKTGTDVTIGGNNYITEGGIVIGTGGAFVAGVPIGDGVGGQDFADLLNDSDGVDDIIWLPGNARSVTFNPAYTGNGG